MSYAIITVRFTLRLVALSLISLGMVVSLAIILITSLVNLTESAAIMPTVTSITPSLVIDESSVHDNDDISLDDLLSAPMFVIDEADKMTMTEIDELIVSLPVDEAVVTLTTITRYPVDMKWNELRSICKAVGIKGCKTRIQYEAAYTEYLTAVN